ncbi:MAG: PLDc N-terminal domain-containing protein [Opitutaceae bacterium]|jgi:hypothetical protein
MNPQSSTLPDIDKIFGYYMNALWAMGALYLLFILFVLAFNIVNFIYTISTLVRAIRSTSPEKTMWVLVIILVPMIGWILYRVLTREPVYTPQAAAIIPRPTQPPVARTTSPVVLHPVCRPAQTAAVADSVQAAMDELVRKRRAERSGRS